MSLPDDDIEDAALDAAMDAEPKSAPEPVSAPEPTDNDAQAAIEGAAPNPEPEATKPRGDLSVALRQERERNKQIEAELAREREERARIVALFERNQPQPQPAQPTPEPEPPSLWTDPKGFIEHELKQRLTPYEQQLAQTREFYSRRAAVSEHGESTVDEAYAALGRAIQAGEIDGPQVVDALRQNADPFGEIVKWHKNRPEVQQASLRSTIEAEILAKYGIAPEQPAAATPPAPAAPAPGAPSLPSLNQANGNAGTQQPANLSEEDIFDSVPAFGKRKA